jgi:hypothetical protein
MRMNCVCVLVVAAACEDVWGYCFHIDCLCLHGPLPGAAGSGWCTNPLLAGMAHRVPHGAVRPRQLMPVCVLLQGICSCTCSVVRSEGWSQWCQVHCRKAVPARNPPFRAAVRLSYRIVMWQCHPVSRCLLSIAALLGQESGLLCIVWLMAVQLSCTASWPCLAGVCIVG